MKIFFILPVFYYFMHTGFLFFPSDNIPQRVTNPVDTIRQNIATTAAPDNNSAFVKILVRDDNEKKLAGIAVLLYNQQWKLYYLTTTDVNGEARFMVPAAKKYVVAIGEMNNMGDVSLPSIGGVVFKKLFYYVPTVVEEKQVGDTLFQEVGDFSKPSSARALVKVLVTDLQKIPLANEEVILKVENKNLIYKAFTDGNGNANLLVPKGQKYKVSFKYDRDVDMFEVDINTGFRTIEIGYEYIGSKKVEEYYANTSRNNQGFITGFLPNKIRKLKKPEGLKVTKKSWGYTMKFPDSSHISTPAIYLEQILVNGGYYDLGFYSFDRVSGNFRWGVQLYEAGTSPVVCDDSVILLNTESCTLYALDAISGDLLWSYWLAPVILSTPTVANGNVITCYPATLAGAAASVIKEKTYAIVCFDLKTGKIKWQNWLDAEILAAPVVHADRVFCTTRSGKVFGCNLNDGKNMVAAAINATAPPVFYNNKLYIPHLKNKQSSDEVLGVFSKDKLTVIRDFSGIARRNIKSISGYTLMHYTGMQPLIIKDKLYSVTDNQITCYHAETGSKIWQRNIIVKNADTNYAIATQPVYAGNKIVVASQDGNVKIFDSEFGKLINEYGVQFPIVTEPVIHDGWIYAGALDGKFVAINTKDKTLTGWPMWKGNGMHNPVITK